MVLKESTNIFDGLPNLCPFNVSFIPGHTASNNAWRTPLAQIGIDVTLINAYFKPKCLTPSLAARKKDYIFSLREGERLKFQRDGVRDSDTKITKSGKDIIRSIINSNNMALIPVSILPCGSTHGLFRRMLFGADAIPLTASDFNNLPQAVIAAPATANSPKVPSRILTRANKIWRYSKPEHQISTYARYSQHEQFEKEFGLTIATAFSNHILRA